jgi:hypothetical protein
MDPAMLSVTTPDLLDSPGEAADARRLPFAFAKRHGVLLIATASGMHLAYRPGTSVTALAEAQRLAGREVDIRVSTLPSSNGERVVLRLLDKQAGRF